MKMLNNDLKRQIKIKNNFFQMIIDLGFDYDGFNSTDDLKKLIDELVRCAKLGLKCNDKEVMFIDGKHNKYNILHEEL